MTDEEKANVKSALIKFKYHCQIAQRFNNGEITDEELEEKYHCELAYVDDDLYDTVSDAIGALYRKNREPIPYQKRPDIYR